MVLFHTVCYRAQCEKNKNLLFITLKEISWNHFYTMIYWCSSWFHEIFRKITCSNVNNVHTVQSVEKYRKRQCLKISWNQLFSNCFLVKTLIWRKNVKFPVKIAIAFYGTFSNCAFANWFNEKNVADNFFHNCECCLN